MLDLARLRPLDQLPARAWRRFGRTPAGHALAARLGPEARPERWVFVTGCYNSGTTLLADALRTHPQVMGPPAEGVYLTDRLSHPEALGWPRMWHVCLDRLEQRPEDFSPDDLRRIRRQWGFWSGPPRPVLVEKSIANTYRMPLLQQLFPGAIFIHVLRDGAAAAEGIRRKARPAERGNPQGLTRYPIELCIRQWRASVELAARDRPRLERFIEVRYEDLTRDIDAELARLAEFIGIAPFAGSHAGVKRVHGEERPVADLNAASRARLSAEDRRIIDREAGDLLRALGYPPADADA